MSKIIIIERGFNNSLIFMDKIVAIRKEYKSSRFGLKILLIDGSAVELDINNEIVCTQVYDEILKFIGNGQKILRIGITELETGSIQ